MRVEIYTDGACLGNPGPGGWAAVLIAGGRRRELSGGEAATTNNRMELRAAIAGLQALKRPSEIVLYTDSRYVKQGITEWAARWQANGWRTAARRAVENQGLWQELLAAAAGHRVEWKWVRGHAGVPENERADLLAREAALEFAEAR
ncbi:MAG TPA: ribonuclease HI [Gammaproteobacteria bacterium]|nr:ribonuclease HI [Gammaproteobacteria bacterium]